MDRVIDKEKIIGIGGRADHSINEIFSTQNKSGKTVYMARLKDGRIFGGSNDTGFHSEQTLLSGHNIIFGGEDEIIPGRIND